MASLVRILRSLGNAGAVANAARVCAERQSTDELIAALEVRFAADAAAAATGRRRAEARRTTAAA